MDQKTRNEAFNEYIKILFNSSSFKERAIAAQNLGNLKEGRAINMLVRALKSEKDDVVINRIIEAMGEIGDSKATMPIIEFLKQEVERQEEDQDKTRLFVIIECLMKIGDKRALEHLGILLDSCHSDIRKLTEEAYECIDPEWKQNIKSI
ncbi:MAG: HEAT repeat domain-containing protein [Candidatus Lokiarchaeota archaeon]|nr:HEAT repeat domain-containing protein [Candidatus Lokiarchaeota archaeon]